MLKGNQEQGTSRLLYSVKGTLLVPLLVLLPLQCESLSTIYSKPFVLVPVPSKFKFCLNKPLNGSIVSFLSTTAGSSFIEFTKHLQLT